MQAYSNPEEVLVRDKKMRKNSSSRKSARLSRKLDTVNTLPPFFQIPPSLYSNPPNIEIIFKLPFFK